VDRRFWVWASLRVLSGDWNERLFMSWILVVCLAESISQGSQVEVPNGSGVSGTITAVYNESEAAYATALRYC
jgi:hypothetical protein